VTIDDPTAVREQYATEENLRARQRLWTTVEGENARLVLFRILSELKPRNVLEVGGGQGELAERMQGELGASVTFVDQSARMVELVRARGIADAQVGDVQELPFEDERFDTVVAAWMLYHVQDVDRAVRELRRVLRPDGRLVAVTNSVDSMHELWSLIGYRPAYAFGAENGEWSLLRHFTVVRRHDVRGTVTFPNREAVHRYVRASVTKADRADNLPFFDGPLVASRHVVVFVAE